MFCLRAARIRARSAQRGMSLIEVLIATAVFLIVAFAAFGLIHEFALTSHRLTAEQRGTAGIAHLLDQWESDEGSSDSIFIPDRDVLGNDNASSPHEIDFYTKDAGNHPYFWAYRWDAGKQTIQRYDYAGIGAAAQPDGAAYPGITRFAPSLHSVDEVSDPASLIYTPIFAPGAYQHTVAFGVGPKVVGGTNIIHINLATSTDAIPVDVAAGSAPSGFTIVLNYTPAPTPTGAALVVIPAAVQYAAAGSQLASVAVPHVFNFGELLNRVLGGGVAEAFAAGTNCPARAYADTGFVNVISPTNAYAAIAAQLGITDPSGCYDGHVLASEGPGGPFGGTFNYDFSSNGCANLVHPLGWNPANAASSPAALGVASSISAGSCVFTIGDGKMPPQSQNVVAQVVAPAPCSVDSFGYCYINKTGQYTLTPCTYSNAGSGGPNNSQPEKLGTVYVNIYSAANGQTTGWPQSSYDDGTGSCSTTLVWDNGDPAIVLGDPNLP